MTDRISVLKTVQTVTMTDFTCIPEVVWVEVMTYLSLCDRSSLSLTCRSLHSVFQHPSLWKSVKIFLLGETTNFGHCKTFMPKSSLEVIKRFGKFFQDLTVTISGHVKEVDSQSRSLLESMASDCRLQSLTLEAGQMISPFHIGGRKPNEADLLAIVALVTKANRLKKINVLSWPMYPEIFHNPKLNIFEAIMSNENLQNLESLSLFWNKRTWSQREPLLPSPEYTLRLVINFKNLTHLALRSAMLNSSIVEELGKSDRTRLKLLQVFVNYSKYHSAFKIPQISSKYWARLKRACPDIQLEIVLMSQVNNEDLEAIMNTETPLVSITFLKYATCNAQTMTYLTVMYKDTLKQFVCHCMVDDIDEPLLELVTKCNQLEELVIAQELKHDTVSTIQSLHKWSHLSLTEK